MKNKRNVFWIIALVAVFIFSTTACFGQSGGKVVNSPEELKAYLDSQPANSPDKPIMVNMRATAQMLPKIVAILNDTGKYVSFNFSGNALTTIPEMVFIDKEAEKGCETLVSVIIPNSVTSIGKGAFGLCTSLTSITIPNSVTSIGYEAFYDTAWFNNQPDGVVYAGKVAYKYKGTMPANTSITLLEGTKGIAGGAFESCKNLTSITIPNSVTSIGESAFYGCTSLTAITVSTDNTEYSTQDGVLYNKDITTLIRYPEGKTGSTFTIPNSVTSIGESAFSKCTRLTSVTIGNSVTSIGESAFNECTRLTSVTIGNSVTSIGDSAFDRCTSLTSVTIPNSVTSIGNRAFDSCTKLTRVTIPNNVTSIGYMAFSNCSLTSVFIPNSVTSIGGGAFVCYSLTSVTFQGAIAADNLNNPFYGDLREKYLAGGIGTYTRPNRDSKTWTKQ